MATLQFGSAKRERKRLHALVEKLDLAAAIYDGLRLSNELIKTLVIGDAHSLVVEIAAARRNRRLSVEQHAKRPRVGLRSAGPWASRLLPRYRGPRLTRSVDRRCGPPLR